MQMPASALPLCKKVIEAEI